MGVLLIARILGEHILIVRPKGQILMRVFLDIDGVLADFHQGILDLYKLTEDEFKTKVKPGSFWWDQDIDPKLMEKLNSEFWAELQKTSDGDDIIQILENEFGQQNICLLTNHVNNPSYAYGKIQWINNHYPQYKHQYLLGTNKYYVANKDTLLVDDADHNCDDFIKHGGHGILIPRYWNSLHTVLEGPFDIIYYLKLRIKQIINH